MRKKRFQYGSQYKIDGPEGQAYEYRGRNLEKGVYIFIGVKENDERQIPITLPARHLDNIEKNKV